MFLIGKKRDYVEKLFFFLKNQMLKSNFTYGFPSIKNVFPEHYVHKFIIILLGLKKIRSGKRHEYERKS